jgi:uncharacterized membrane protein YgdD (TMEM256/DUF423 family)
MDRLLLAASGISGFCAVAAGAFGAHALRERLAPDLLAVYQTGALYHLVHSLALGLVALAAARWPGAVTTWSGWLFAAGIVLFSGSLYALALSGVRVLGAITPLGGLCFLGGWALLAVAALRATAR